MSISCGRGVSVEVATDPPKPHQKMSGQRNLIAKSTYNIHFHLAAAANLITIFSHAWITRPPLALPPPMSSEQCRDQKELGNKLAASAACDVEIILLRRRVSTCTYLSLHTAATAITWDIGCCCYGEIIEFVLATSYLMQPRWINQLSCLTI